MIKDIEKVREMLQRKMSYKEIATELKVPYMTLYNFCRRKNLVKSKPIDAYTKEILENNTSYEAAEILHITVNKVRYLRNRYNLSYKRIKNQKHLDILKDYASGMKQVDIAKKYNVTRQYVSLMVKSL